MINLRTITEEYFDTIIKMKHPERENFVASNDYSLAQAWLYRDDGDVFPFAIYDYDTIAPLFSTILKTVQKSFTHRHGLATHGCSAVP